VRRLDGALMTLCELMESLRKGLKKQTKFYGITLTKEEVGPILEEYDRLIQAAVGRRAKRARPKGRALLR
jgi:hypothetical protein